MQRHTPIIALRAAQSRYQLATETCPHWDYVNDQNPGEHDCCRELVEAQQEVRRLRREALKPR